MLVALPDTLFLGSELEARAVELFGTELCNSFIFAVMMKRLAVMRPDLSYSPLVVLLSAILSDRVGIGIQWCYTIVDFNRRFGFPLSITEFAERFGKGLPTEDERHRLWLAQKRDRDKFSSDNQLDGREAWAAAHAVIS